MHDSRYNLCILVLLYQRVLISPTLFQFIPNYYKFYRNAGDDSTVAIIRDFLRQLNDIVKSHPGGFLSEGDSPGAVDYLIWPWLERYAALKIIAPRKLELRSCCECDNVSGTPLIRTH